MQIVQFFPSSLRKDTITAHSDKVVVHCKSPISEYEYEYNYRDLSTSLVKGKTGDGGWDMTALLVFLLSVGIDALARFLFHFNSFAIYAMGFTLAASLFCLRFVKYNFVGFFTTRDDSAIFSIYSRGNLRTRICGETGAKLLEIVRYRATRCGSEPRNMLILAIYADLTQMP